MLITSTTPRMYHEQAGDGAGTGGDSGQLGTWTNNSGDSDGQQSQSLTTSLEDGGANHSGGTSGDAGVPAEERIVGKGTFYEGLEEGLFTDPALKPFLDKDGTLNGKNIIKSYVHAKRQLGANKITVPGENASDDEWREAFVALGLGDREAYNVSEKNEGLMGQEFLDKFKEEAYNNHILPQQAQKLFDWLSDQVSDLNTEGEREAQEKSEFEEAGLKKEWGEAYDRNFLMARKAFQQFATPEQQKAVEAAGLGTDPTLQRIFYNVAQNLNEDTFKGDSLPKGVLSPDEAKREINAAMSDPRGPYLNAAHPNHDAEVKRISKLFGIAG
jgi:hypothetical protein